MNVALFTDAFADRSLEEALRWAAEREIAGVELGVGAYSPAPHLDAQSLLAGEAGRRALLDALEAARIELVALNAAGNPLHPDASIAADHDRALREALRLATALGVPRVVAMSGCPGGPGGGGWPVFAGGAWLPDMEGAWERQWDEAIRPYWAELSAWAEREAPGVSICLELHPGTSIYNAASFRLLASAVGDNVGVNFDPSHFWWQGIDPITTLGAIGDRVRFAHGKDTIIYPEQLALHGVLDFRWPTGDDTAPWDFCAVGHGRPIAEWVKLIDALATAGYDGPISIEHEDPKLSSEAGVEASLAGLREAIAADAERSSRVVA